MPTIKEIWEKKNGYTKSASELSRNLCFAGLAVVWIFRVPNGGEHSAIPTTLMWCALGFVIALGLDLLQYLVGAQRTKAFGDLKEEEFRIAEERGSSMDRTATEFLYPPSHRQAMDGFWGIKVLVTLVTWIVLAVYIGIAAAGAALPKLT